MSAFRPDAERRLVPRWLSSAQAASCGELRAATAAPAKPATVARDFEQLQVLWKEDRSVENAADLVATGIVLGRTKDIQDAAAFLDRGDVDVAPVIRDLAHRALMTNVPDRPREEFELHRETVHARIAHHRLRVRAYPRNPIAWVELARCQTVLGQLKAAKRAVRIAVALARENRYVLRSASRFFVHRHDFDAALSLLRGARALRTDPWLMSAEMSISMIAGTDPLSYKRARAIVDADDLPPWHTGELHGALGSMALHDRRVGKVGKLFARSLRKPTENVVAQAQWAANRSEAVEVPDQLIDRPHSYEAVALRARAARNWNQVIESCFGWSALDPTSARPLMQGAFSAGSAFGDGVTMLRFTERLMLGASHDPMVLNNHAVALAYAGRVEEAQNVIARINSRSLNDYLKVYEQATRGLIAYRSGDHEAGQTLYLEAAEFPGAKTDPVVMAQLFWHWLREEARLGVPETEELADVLWERTQKLPLPELAGLRQSVRETIEHVKVAGPHVVKPIEADARKQVIAHFPDGHSFVVRLN